MCLLNVIGWFMIKWLQINATFPRGQLVKNCCPPLTKQILLEKLYGTGMLKNSTFPPYHALKFSSWWKRKIQKATENAMATLLALYNEISPNESSPRDDKYLEELSSELLFLTDFYPNASRDVQKKSIGQNISTWISIPPPPISVLVMSVNARGGGESAMGLTFISDQEFSKWNNLCEAATVEINRKGFGNVKHHNTISKEDPCWVHHHALPNLSTKRENLRLLTKQSFAITAQGTTTRTTPQVKDEGVRERRPILSGEGII